MNWIKALKFLTKCVIFVFCQNTVFTLMFAVMTVCGCPPTDMQVEKAYSLGNVELILCAGLTAVEKIKELFDEKRSADA